MLLISFHLLLGLLELLVPELDHVFLLLDFFDGFLEISLYLVQARELLLDFVFLSSDVLDLLHKLGVLLGEHLDVSLELADLTLGRHALGLVVDDLVLRLDKLLPEAVQLVCEDDDETVGLHVELLDRRGKLLRDAGFKGGLLGWRGLRCWQLFGRGLR
jgi:hypothetical protein